MPTKMNAAFLSPKGQDDERYDVFVTNTTDLAVTNRVTMLRGYHSDILTNIDRFFDHHLVCID